MPTGLLNSFAKEEILDLIAYLRSVPAAEKKERSLTGE
jgi:hypothetical protein